MLGDSGFGVRDIAEGDRRGRACLLACRDDRTVLDVVRAGHVRIDARLADALDAVRALLHHTPGPNGHLGVEPQRQRPLDVQMCVGLKLGEHIREELLAAIGRVVEPVEPTSPFWPLLPVGPVGPATVESAPSAPTSPF